MRREERLLRGVLSVVRVAQEHQADAVHGAAVLCIELVETRADRLGREAAGATDDRVHGHRVLVGRPVTLPGFWVARSEPG